MKRVQKNTAMERIIWTCPKCPDKEWIKYNKKEESEEDKDKFAVIEEYKEKIGKMNNQIEENEKQIAYLKRGTDIKNMRIDELNDEKKELEINIREMTKIKEDHYAQYIEEKKKKEETEKNLESTNGELQKLWKTLREERESKDEEKNEKNGVKR